MNEVITGAQIRAARESVAWDQRRLAQRAKVSLGVVQRAETSPGEPVITIAQLDALMQALRSAGATFPSASPTAAR